MITHPAGDRESVAKKLIVLGMDAASPRLIRRWAEEEKLPAIRTLIEGGLSGTIAGVEGFFIGSTWPSFYTGLDPSGHGVYRIDQLRSGTYESFRPFDVDDGIGGIPFWRLASDAGRRVAILDVPLSRLESSLNGVQTIEWGGHDAVFGFQTSPTELRNEILTQVGAYPLPADCNARRRTVADYEAFVAGLERAAAMRANLTLDILQREDWDLVVQVFTESHCVGHQCWHLHDPRHPAHDPEVRAVLGDPLERVYRAIDAGLARILDHAGDARVLVFSAHGMSYFRGAHFLLPEILHRLGVSTRRVAPRRQTVRTIALNTGRSLARKLPERLRDAIRPLQSQIRGKNGDDRSIRLDRERSRCFPVANGFPVAGIRLNLIGREPAGILKPGPEADAFCEMLATKLLAIVDERTGAPLISRVLRTEQLYSGARRDALPDLLVEWNDVLPIGTLGLANGNGAKVRASSPTIGTIEGSNNWGRTGEHVPEGFFVLSGQGIPAGRSDGSVSLIDIYPTICRLLDLAHPGASGAVIPDLAAWT